MAVRRYKFYLIMLKVNMSTTRSLRLLVKDIFSTNLVPKAFPCVVATATTT